MQKFSRLQGGVPSIDKLNIVYWLIKLLTKKFSIDHHADEVYYINTNIFFAIL